VVRLGEVDVSFVPAGHVLGSAQIVLEHGGERVVVSGDYKRRPDPTCAPFEPVPCDIFITEATFGLPVFRHPDTGSEIDRLLARLHANPGPLRAGRRLCARQGAAGDHGAAGRGHHEPIYIHGALQRLCDLYEEHGVALGDSARPPARRRTS
jgi:putative mRNA 3-end processing factor